MKKLLILLILPLSIFGQKPIRQYKFVSRQPSIFTSDVSISPSGNLLLATFSDFNKIFLYELIQLSDGKIISKGSLEDKPMSISWSDDDKMVVMNFVKKPPVCYDPAAGMKKLFDCKEDGTIMFTKNSSLFAGKKDPAYLYVFASESINKYNDKGELGATYDLDGFNSFSYGWYHSPSRTFKLATDDSVLTYGLDGIEKGSFPLESVELIDAQKTDKDGAYYLYHDKDHLFVYQVSTGNKLAAIQLNNIGACTFTPDSKSILVCTYDSLYLMNLNGKIINSIPLTVYFSDIYYSAFGTELVGVNPEGVNIYACNNYMPVYENKHAPGVKNPSQTVIANPSAPVVIPQKPLTIPVPQTVNEKWPLPYTMTDFIVPLQKDSFYLYSPDGKLRNCIIYKKREGTSLWSNTYSYYHYFGFSNEAKFAEATIHILELTNSEAIIRTYSKSGIIEKPTMLGLLGYLAKIPLEAGKTTSWPMKIYSDDQYTLSAKIIENTYRGKKDKCLTVTREDFVNGKISVEVNFYQKGVGLIKTEVNGNVAYQR